MRNKGTDPHSQLQDTAPRGKGSGQQACSSSTNLCELQNLLVQNHNLRIQLLPKLWTTSHISFLALRSSQEVDDLNHNVSTPGNLAVRRKALKEVSWSLPALPEVEVFRNNYSNASMQPGLQEKQPSQMPHFTTATFIILSFPFNFKV